MELPYGRVGELREFTPTPRGQCLYYYKGSCLSPIRTGCEVNGRCNYEDGIILNHAKRILNRKPAIASGKETAN